MDFRSIGCLIRAKCLNLPRYSFRDLLLFQKMDKQKVVAVVPAYKEEERIGKILEELKSSHLIDEIIVVDDGSKDLTYKVAGEHGVECYICDSNYGKGSAMDIGVKISKADIILFCDADLIGFTGEMADSIIEPLLKNGIEMVVGTPRLMENSLCLWSGQRAIKKGLWQKLPKFYKKGFRIELGLNLFASSRKVVHMAYSQEIKEKKHGFIMGFYRRFFMYLQICSAIIRYALYDSWKIKLSSS